MRPGPIPTVATDDIGIQRPFTFVVPMFPFEPVMYTATFWARFLPLIFVPLMIVLGVRGAPLVALYFVVGTPCSVTSYVMAKKMGADGELAAHLVVLQTVFSVLSVFAVLLILGTLGYT